jgi:hypothetical protein
MPTTTYEKRAMSGADYALARRLREDPLSTLSIQQMADARAKEFERTQLLSNPCGCVFTRDRSYCDPCDECRALAGLPARGTEGYEWFNFSGLMEEEGEVR